MPRTVEALAASLSPKERTDLRDIASGARVFTRHIFLYDDGLVERRLRGVITNYADCPLELTDLGQAVLAHIGPTDAPPDQDNTAAT